MKLTTLHTIARLIVVLILTIWTITTPVRASEVICRTSGIEGFEEVAKTAKNYIGKSTKELSEAKIYVTVEKDHLYIHSNYKTGKKDEIVLFPTKYITDTLKSDLKGYTYYNIVGPADLSDVSLSTFNLHFREIEFYVDQKLFSDPKFSKLDLGDATIRVVDRHGIPHITDIVPNTRNERMVELHSDVYARLTPEGVCNLAEHVSLLWDIADLIGKAESKRLNSDNLKTNINDKRVVQAEKQSTYGNFFSELKSLGFTLVDLTCKTHANKNKLSLTVYEEPSETEIASSIVDNVGDIEIILADFDKKPQPTAPTTQAEAENNRPCCLGLMVILVLAWSCGTYSKIKEQQKE
jgi:hypothetical protein